jgi:hypothetical protein
LGHQTIGDVTVALQEQGVGAQTMAAVVVLGDALSLSTDETCGSNHQETPMGILNAIVLKVSNGPAEGINSRIKMIKVRSRGFRNKQRFANAIYFYLGGLDLYPATAIRAGSPT